MNWERTSLLFKGLWMTSRWTTVETSSKTKCRMAKATIIWPCRTWWRLLWLAKFNSKSNSNLKRAKEVSCSTSGAETLRLTRISSSESIKIKTRIMIKGLIWKTLEFHNWKSRTQEAKSKDSITSKKFTRWTKVTMAKTTKCRSKCRTRWTQTCQWICL